MRCAWHACEGKVKCLGQGASQVYPPYMTYQCSEGHKWCARGADKTPVTRDELLGFFSKKGYQA